MNEQAEPHPADKILGADYQAPLEVLRKKAWDALPASERARLERLVAVDENGVSDWYLIVEPDPEDNEFERFVARPRREDDFRFELIGRWLVAAVTVPDERARSIVEEHRDD
jgi:hypothetical protein